jgi:protein-S-isoprenylcysteine O-methyltransferase Ste14
VQLFTFPQALAFWLVYVGSMVPEFRIVLGGRRRAARHGSPDAGSFGVILIGQSTALIAGFWLAFLPMGRLPVAWQAFAYWLGTGLLLAGTALRWYCRRLLGEDFTADVRVRSDQAVVDRGAYRWIRHPSYLAGLIVFTAIGLALGSWASLAVLVGTTAGVYLYRMPVAERALEAALGGEYREYMRTHKRLIPFVY